MKDSVVCLTTYLHIGQAQRAKKDHHQKSFLKRNITSMFFYLKQCSETKKSLGYSGRANAKKIQKRTQMRNE